MEDFKTFELFPDDNLKWITNTSGSLVNKEIVNIVAYVLVDTIP